MPENNHRIHNRKNDLFLLAGIILAVLLVNIINQSLFFRVDLTAEKRYTLSDESKEILRNLDDVVYVNVYLDGDLNIPFKKFQRAIRDMLDEFRVYGKSSFQYSFENPFEDAGPEMQNKIIEELYNKGLRPTNIHSRDKEAGVSEKIIFPGAIISYREYEMPVNLLMNNQGQSADQNLNNSLESLEYELISTIKNVTTEETRKIAFLEGHGELNHLQVNDISRELSKSFQIDRGIIQGKPGVLDDYEVVIIAQPTVSFTEADKFVVDQYIMSGGKVLWLLDEVQVSLDSLVNGETLAFIRNLNLDDMLFHYGVRILPELIQDIRCNVIPINVALSGNAPNFQPAPWLYYPLLSPNTRHIIGRNLDLVLGRFVNPMDTIAARRNIVKTVLLQSSDYSKTRKVPSLISLEEIKEVPDESEFSHPNLIAGVLLEGAFESAFTNRGIDAYFDEPPPVKEKGISTKMAVLSDGDLIRNDVKYSASGPSVGALGFDRYTRKTFANKDFLVNLVQYLADDDNLIALRGREFKLRMLDKEKISSERKKWIVLNMLIPSLLVILFGVFFVYYRKRRFAK